jgi:nucleotide-binding universal stress UspA family protein
MSTIVVGVDGSDSARAALDFALQEARLRNASVRVVSAWQLPAVAYAGGYGPGDSELYSELEQEARIHATRAIDHADAEGIDVTAVVRGGNPSHVLLAEAGDADLLVVGSRGLGGFRGLLLGSVGQQCAHHAVCPLVIVPHRPEL